MAPTHASRAGDRPTPSKRRLTADEFNSVVSAVTNAFGDPTRREIYLFVRDAGDHGRHRRRGRRALRPAPQRRPPPPREAHGRRLPRSSRSDARPATAAPAPRAARRSATAPVRSTPPSRSRSSTTTCSAGLLAGALDALGPEQAERARRRGRLPVRATARRADGPDRRPPFGARRARRRRRRAHRARVRRAHRSARRQPRHRLRVLPVRRDRARGTRTSCARSTAA